MKKYLITSICTVLPLACYAHSSPLDNNIFKIIAAGFVLVFFLIFLALIWIQIEAIKNKKKDGSTKLSKEDKAIVRKFQQENDNLRQELSEKDDEIGSLKDKLTEKDNEIALLKRQIKESISSSFRSSMPSNDSNKQEDNNEKTGIGVNNNTNSSLFVGQNYIELSVINGNLVKAESEQTTYYRAWREKGLILFEFVNNDRTRKAINNRTIIIEPFCIKQDSSKSPDVSEEIETKTPGILNDDYTLRKKAEIIYK